MYILIVGNYDGKHLGCKVDTASDGLEARDYCLSLEFDAVVLVPPFRDMTAIQLVRELRAEKVQVPIVLLADASVNPANMTDMLAAGMDAHAPLASSPEYVRALLQAVIRRSQGHARSVISVGGLCVDMTNRTVSIDGEQAHLTGKEYEMLELLALRQGQVVTKEAFMSHLYQERDEPEIKIIDVLICKLRKKVPGYIETVWGRGYVLRENAAVAA